MGWWHFLNIITSLNTALDKQHWTTGYRMADELDTAMGTTPAPVVTHAVFGIPRYKP